MRLTLSECKNKIAEYKARCADLYGIERIGIFGSTARGDNRDDSDVDIVVSLSQPTFRIMNDIRQTLNELFDRHVDVVRYRQSLRSDFKRNLEKDVIYV